MDTVASLGTSEDGMLVELHTLQLHLCLSFDVGHLLAPTSMSAELISTCGKAASSQHSRLLQRVPQAASSSPARGSGWLPGGAACGTSVLACGAQIRQICSLSLPPL